MISDAYLDRFETSKYRSRNPIKRRLIRDFADRVHGYFVAANPAQRILEVGVGEGFISGYLSECFPDKHFVGVDLDGADLARLTAKFPGIETHEGNVYDLSFLEGGFDVVICCEVLEHLEQPERALEQIAALAPRHCIFSVPHEPFFMLSNLAAGKNLRRLGNDPEHVNHYTRRSFAKLLRRHFDIIDQAQPYPWLLALVSGR